MTDIRDLLFRSPNSAIFIISDTEVGKIHTTHLVWTDTKGNVVPAPFPFRNTIDEQALLLKYANSINDLMVKFVRKDTYDDNEMLVMERLYPMPIDGLTKAEKQKFLSDFEEKIKELHEADFIHGDILRPRTRTPECFDNIVLTKDGFRLIDADFSIRMKRDNIREFVYKKRDEEGELDAFRSYLLGI